MKQSNHEFLCLRISCPECQPDKWIKSYCRIIEIKQVWLSCSLIILSLLTVKPTCYFLSRSRKSTYQQGLIGLMINTNGSMITWPQAQISGLQTLWPIICLELSLSTTAPPRSLTQTQLFSDGEQCSGKSPNISSTEAKKALFSIQMIIILVFSVVIYLINFENVCLSLLDVGNVSKKVFTEKSNYFVSTETVWGLEEREGTRGGV